MGGFSFSFCRPSSNVCWSLALIRSHQEADWKMCVCDGGAFTDLWPSCRTVEAFSWGLRNVDRWQAFSGTIQFFERSILHSPSPPSLFVEGAESGAGWELLFVASSLMSTALAIPKSKASLKIGMWGMVCVTLV